MKCAEARTTTLNEELGQVRYIFSDKTGTLTQNIMQFKMASIGGISYGGKNSEEGEKREKCDFQVFNPEFIDPDLEFYDNRLLEHISEKRYEVKEFFMLLALNHTVWGQRFYFYFYGFELQRFQSETNRSQL